MKQSIIVLSLALVAGTSFARPAQAPAASAAATTVATGDGTTPGTP